MNIATSNFEHAKAGLYVAAADIDYVLIFRKELGESAMSEFLYSKLISKSGDIRTKNHVIYKRLKGSLRFMSFKKGPVESMGYSFHLGQAMNRTKFPMIVLPVFQVVGATDSQGKLTRQVTMVFITLHLRSNYLDTHKKL